MIDPLLCFAMSMHANPGVYAVLLGSGVSRPAGIPTGWEVVLDLIRRLAKLVEEECDPDPEAWFRVKYEQQPTYSGLLDEVAKSQAERSRLLAGYFEPTDEERERGLKVPSPAHHALARLVKSGHVKVILTTNFDRLIEQALEAVGVPPTVISSADAVEGAMPLVHGRCTVVKLHGDYLDVRTRNTPVELDTYDAKVDALLDRVFDEFGLVVCGWSAEWDAALRRAMERCKTRRFTTYWTVKGALCEAAKGLIGLRGAQTISIESADQFFTQLAEKVVALSEIDHPHPLSARVAVAQAKRYLSEAKYRIQLHDLLTQEVERIVDETGGERYPVTGSLKKEDVVKRIADFEAFSEVAVALMAAGCYWGGKEHLPLWINAMKRLASPSCPKAWNGVKQGLRMYPALLLLYAGGMAALAAGHYDTLYELFREPTVREHGRSYSLIIGLFDNLRPEVFQVLFEPQKKKVPRSERLFAVLREPLLEILPDDEAYERTFDRFEALQSFWTADTTGRAMPGAFMYRYDGNGEGSVLAEIVNERQVQGDNWPLFKVGFFEGKPDRWEPAPKAVLDATKHFAW